MLPAVCAPQQLYVRGVIAERRVHRQVFSEACGIPSHEEAARPLCVRPRRQVLRLGDVTVPRRVERLGERRACVGDESRRRRRREEGRLHKLAHEINDGFVVKVREHHHVRNVPPLRNELVRGILATYTTSDPKPCVVRVRPEALLQQRNHPVNLRSELGGKLLVAQLLEPSPRKNVNTCTKLDTAGIRNIASTAHDTHA